MIEPLSLILSAMLAVQQQPAEAPADNASEQVAATSEEAVNDDDKIICKRTAVIGSKFKKKICGTKKQWETLENNSTDSTREMQRKGKGLEPVR